MTISNMDNTLFLGSSRKAFSNARELRKSMTEAEVMLWEKLRNKKLKGLKFRRQHPIAGYIADFYCHEIKLIIELDGGIHDLPDYKEHDEGRTFKLEASVIMVIRFKNDEVLYNIEEVLNRIIQIIEP